MDAQHETEPIDQVITMKQQALQAILGGTLGKSEPKTKGSWCNMYVVFLRASVC